MSTITTRSGKGSPLTNSEVDTNFTNLNTDKLENITGESIKNLSDVNSSMSPSAGDALVYDANNGWQSGTVSSGAVANTVAVTVANSKFVIDGTSQQALTLSPSITYRFDQSDSSNASHPLKFSTTNDGTHNSGAAFTTGVTVSGTAGSTGAYVEVKLEQDAPSALYYYCANHSGMGGAVSVGGSGGAAITVQDEGSSLSTAAETINFTGAGVTASGSGTAKTINIPGATVTTNGSLDPVKQTEFTATANQTSFSVAYGVGNISVYLNGAKLAAADYTATNGTSVVLSTGATVGDLVVVEEYGVPFSSPYSANVFTASAGQTTLSVNYTVAKVAVYVNGVKLLIGTNADVVAANGTSLTFNTALSAGDKIEVVEHGALVEGSTTFVGLTDTPSSLGSAGQVAQVNSAGNAIEFGDVSAGVTVYTGLSGTDGTPSGATYLLNASSPSAGDLAYVTANTGLYQNNGNGWYKIATINTTPAIGSVSETTSGSTTTLSNNGTFNLTAGANTVVTITASDADEGTDLTYTHTVTSGTESNVATITQGTGASENVFTFAPATSVGGTITVRFDVTDNTNTAQFTNSFTLSLSAPYTLQNDSYDSLAKDLSSGFGTPSGFVFNSTGTKIYVTTSLRLILEYSMSTAWDIANASYTNDYNFGNQIGSTFCDPGSLTIGDSDSKLWFTSYNTQKVHQFNFGSGSSSVTSLSRSNSNDYSFSSTQTSYGRAMLWNNNGTVFWLFNDTQNLYEYTTTNWNVSGASHNATISYHLPAANIRGAFWNDDGTKVFLNDYSYLKQYSVSTAYDLGSTLTDDSENIHLGAQKGSSNYGGFINGDFNRTSTTIGGTSIAAGRKIFSMWNSAPISGGTPYNGTRMFRYSVG